MFHCDVCGATQSRAELVTEVFEIDSRRVLVEQIPARVCIRCGDMTFSRETTEKVRQMVHGAAQPVKTVRMEVFAFA